MKHPYKYILTTLLCCITTLVSAQLYTTCDRWGNYSTGGYNIYNNIWGTRTGSQCLTVYNYNNWYVDANFAASRRGGVKSYPNVEKKVNQFVDNMGAISSSFTVTRPASGGSYVTSYDIWYDNYAYEVMLWMNYNGAVGPISYSYSCNGACPEATNVTVGGHTWNVYRGSNGSNQVFSFLRTSNTNSGSVDITAISKWIRARGWFGNANLHSIQLGFEITSTSGLQRFSVTNFSVSGTGVTAASDPDVAAEIQALPAIESVTIRPNPAQSTATVKLNESWVGGNIQLIGSSSQVFRSAMIRQPEVELDLHSIPAGLYIIQVTKGSRKSAVKLMKE